MGVNQETWKKHLFTWKIENFSMCSENTGQCLSSPTFKATSLNQTFWRLKLFPRGKVENTHISCVLNRVRNYTNPITIECESLVEIIDEKGRSFISGKDRKLFKKGGEFRVFSMTREELRNITLHEDTLIIRCQLRADVPGKVSCSQNSCTTTIKTKKYSLQWDVTNLNTLPHQEVSKFIFSESTQFEITVKIPEDDIKIYIGLKTHLSSNFVVCSCVLLDNDGKERVLKRATHLFEDDVAWEFPAFIKKSQLNAEIDEYLKYDCFAMKCDFIVSDGTNSGQVEEVEDHSISDKVASGDDCFAILQEDIRRLNTDKILTDVKLKVGAQIFSAHKCILSARSPVFFLMFNQDMAESQKGEVDIQDLDTKTVELFLQYIYSGTVNGLDYENAMKLIMAAEKYQVLFLKNNCAELLASKLCDSNVCEILVVADLVQHATLKDSAFDYIRRQPDKIFSSEEWQNCIKNNLLLATETVSKVSRLWGEQTKKTICFLNAFWCIF